MNALLVILLVVGTSISCVALGVFSAYCAVTGLLAALNPSRPSAQISVLVAHHTPASGD